MPKAPRASSASSRSATNVHVSSNKSAVFMSIKQEHMENIASGRKNHEYRKYLLPASVRYIWFYTTSPVSAIQFVARISSGKTPGEVPEDGGIGNSDFNQGKKVSKYGYEILDLWQLKEQISLQDAISAGVLKGPPQKYTFVTEKTRRRWPLDEQTLITQEITTP